MKVASTVYATDQGLGYLARMFHRAGVVTDPVVIRHRRHPTHDDWYPGAYQMTNLKDRRQREVLFDHVGGCDAALFFETPFVWELIAHCRQKGIRTALMVMHECMPKQLPETPDVLLCPSLLDHQVYPDGVYLPVPADPDIVWRERGTITTFVHNAGHGGLKGRNGTAEFVQAMKLVQSPCNFRLISQVPLRHEDFYEAFDTFKTIGGPLAIAGNPKKQTLYANWGGGWPREKLYDEGECFVFPEQFNGLSLPLQEAFAAGMVVAATARFPNLTYLPFKPLIPAANYVQDNVAAHCNSFRRAVVDPADIARKIDSLYGTDGSEYSRQGKQWAEENPWERWKPEYLEVLSK